MNTETPIQQPPAQPEIPVSSNTGIPPPPPEIIPAQGGSRLSPLQIAIIILAVLAIGGGLAFFALPQTRTPTPTPTPIPPTSIPVPSVADQSGSLNMAISDDPAILEKEINDINLEVLNEEEASIDQELTNL